MFKTLRGVAPLCRSMCGCADWTGRCWSSGRTRDAILRGVASVESEFRTSERPNKSECVTCGVYAVPGKSRDTVSHRFRGPCLEYGASSDTETGVAALS